MKPDWDRLGSEYADSSVLIGDVDCTAEGESLCERFEVRGCKCWLSAQHNHHFSIALLLVLQRKLKLT